jgi:hypothetical protein
VLAQAVSADELASFEPRRWDAIIRPEMELERLVELCDDHVRGKQFRSWRLLLASSRCLSPGRYDYFSARSKAGSLGHVVAPGLIAWQFEIVVGLSVELRDHLLNVFRGIFGSSLIAVLARGARVMTSRRARQIDPANRHLSGSEIVESPFEKRGATPLAIHLIIDVDSHASAFGGWPSCAFPIEVEIIRSTRSRWRSQITHALQTVVLDAPGVDTAVDPRDATERRLGESHDPSAEEVPISKLIASKKGAAQPATPVPWYVVEMCMRDNPRLELPPVRLDARGRVVKGMELVVAARRAGRASIPSRPASGSRPGP